MFQNLLVLLYLLQLYHYGGNHHHSRLPTFYSHYHLLLPRFRLYDFRCGVSLDLATKSTGI